MARICVSVVVNAAPDVVWADVSDISTHVEWMADAVQIRFPSSQRDGVGTRFECLTKVGPIRMTDVMVCTEWVPGEAIGIRHEGIVTGTGRLTLEPVGEARTRFTWTETLKFPILLGGPLGAAIGGRLVLRRLWQKNLRAFAVRFEP